VFELDGYLARIGAGRGSGLAEVHRAHLATIPFENIDPCRGIPVSVELDDIYDKLVVRERGGYCFEHNLLFKAAAEAMGASVEMFLARVRLGAEPGVLSPRSHLVLRVNLEGREMLADVGFGRDTLLEPITFDINEVQSQGGRQYRLVDEGAELVLQSKAGGEWVDSYTFPTTPVPLIDVETINWWTSTNPNSAFVTGFVVAIQSDEDTRTSLSDWSGELTLVKSTPDSRESTLVDRAQIPDLLAQYFNLPGFRMDAEGKLAGG
jgi:N-hydroxyarylamine O-acetyltransferase